MTEPTDRDGAPLILGATYRSTTGNKFRCTNADPTLSDDCFVRQSDGEVFKLREVGERRDNPCCYFFPVLPFCRVLAGLCGRVVCTCSADHEGEIS